jgi:glycosyltransferase 2 family protein
VVAPSVLFAAVACLGQSLGLHVPFYQYCLFVPVIATLATLPISIGGLGVVEGMYVYFFGGAGGAMSAPVLALALLVRFAPMLLALPGAAFWLRERHRPGGTDTAPACPVP